MSSCLVRSVEKGHCPLPRYQPGLIDPAIAGETEHLVGMVFPCELHLQEVMLARAFACLSFRFGRGFFPSSHLGEEA